MTISTPQPTVCHSPHTTLAQWPREHTTLPPRLHHAYTTLTHHLGHATSPRLQPILGTSATLVVLILSTFIGFAHCCIVTVDTIGETMGAGNTDAGSTKDRHGPLLATALGACTWATFNVPPTPCFTVRVCLYFVSHFDSTSITLSHTLTP